MVFKFIIKVLKWYVELRTKFWGNYYHYLKSVKEAERRAEGVTTHYRQRSDKQKGKRTYVYFLGGKYRVLNRDQVLVLRNAKAIRRSMGTRKMRPVLCYDTEGHVNSHKTWTQLEIKGIDIVYQKL